MIHCRLSVEKCSAFWAEGIAMVTIVASSTTISCATLSRASTAHRFGSPCLEAMGRVLANASVVVSAVLIGCSSVGAPRHASWRRCQAIESRNSLVRDRGVVLVHDWDREERSALTGPV